MAAEATGSDESLPPQLARLPAGRHGLPRDFVAANHRDRLIAAFVVVIGERGYAGTTVAHVIKAAAVSRRTFYEHFESKEACFIATYDLITEHLRGQILSAMGEQEDPALRVRAGLAALLHFFAAEPHLARLFMVESLAAGPPVSEHHRETIETLAPLLREAAPPPASIPCPSEHTEQAVVAGGASLVSRRIVAGEAEQLEALLPDLVRTALTPYIGAASAERIASLPS